MGSLGTTTITGNGRRFGNERELRNLFKVDGIEVFSENKTSLHLGKETEETGGRKWFGITGRVG